MRSPSSRVHREPRCSEAKQACYEYESATIASSILLRTMSSSYWSFASLTAVRHIAEAQNGV